MDGKKRLRDLLKAPGVIQAAGVADAIQGLLVESVGYPAVYMSGALVNYSRGVPDGTLSFTEIVDRLQEISERVSIPVIADADEGFGGVYEIGRTVREFERVGAAALHLEDMIGKKNGTPIPIRQMVKRIEVALDSRVNQDFVIIARTDTMAPWRLGPSNQLSESAQNEAFERLHAYAEAGADVLMPIYPTKDWLVRFGNSLPKPIMPVGGSNVATKVSSPDPQRPVRSSDMSVAELEVYNVKIVPYATSILSRILPVMRKEYAKWLEEGIFIATEKDHDARRDLNSLIGVEEKRAITKMPKA